MVEEGTGRAVNWAAGLAWILSVAIRTGIVMRFGADKQFFADCLSLEVLKTVLLAATIVWPTATPFWMEHKPGE